MATNNRQKLLVIIAAVGASLFVIDRFIIEPLYTSWGERTEQISKLRQQISRGEQMALTERSLKDKWTDMKKNTLPLNTSATEATILKAFDRWSKDSGVSISGTSPQWKHNEDEYMTFECGADVLGDMRSLTRFLYDIESDPLAIKVESADMSAKDTTGRQIALNLRISALVLVPADQQQ